MERLSTPLLIQGEDNKTKARQQECAGRVMYVRQKNARQHVRRTDGRRMRVSKKGVRRYLTFAEVEGLATLSLKDDGGPHFMLQIDFIDIYWI
jgi:hypothetical protein